MNQNPYQFARPLDPVNDKVVCVPRKKDIKRLVNGINRGEYWAILGARQIGKTSLLLQLRHQFPNSHYLYFNFEVPPTNEKNLYRLLINKLMKRIPSYYTVDIGKIRQDEKPDFRFFQFLKKFNPKDLSQKIIFLFDKIDLLPSLGHFLHVWRNLYHERYQQKNLCRYAAIITGSVDLIEKTGGPNSPFNIAKIFEIKDLSIEESAGLIEKPMNQLNINIEPDAREYLIYQASGHPQLLQHLCHLLVETALKSHKNVTVKEVDKAIAELYKTNSTLNILEQHLKDSKDLADLVKKIMKGEKKVYYPYKEFSFAGVGAIIDNKGYCSIRNYIFEKFIKQVTAEVK